MISGGLAGGSTTEKDSDVNWGDVWSSGNPLAAIPAYAAEPGTPVSPSTVTNVNEKALILKFLITQILAIFAQSQSPNTQFIAKIVLLSFALSNIAKTLSKWLAIKLYGTERDQGLIALYFLTLALQGYIVAAVTGIHNSSAASIMVKFFSPFLLVAVPWVEAIAESNLRYE